MTTTRVTILGCGGSSGTPAVDWGWGDCDPKNPKNRRLRPSILVERRATKLLVDTSPDLRQQCLEAGIDRIDGVAYTHYHADHLHGIDDLRPLNRVLNAPLPVFCDKDTLGEIAQRFAYVLEPLAAGATVYYKPTLEPRELSDGQIASLGDLTFQVFDQDHGYCRTLGYRFGPIAYSTDVVELPEAAFEVLAGVDTWIIGTLTETVHPTHAHVDKALGWIERVGARRGILTHLSGKMDYAALKAKLPDHVEPGYDGLVIELAG